MELYSMFKDYINPYSCPIEVMERKVLSNTWLCCQFWLTQDWFMDQVEHSCGTEMAIAMNLTFEAIVPNMRELCPGNAYDQFGCKLLLHLIILTLLLGVAFIVWTVIVTIFWIRLRRQLRNMPNQRAKMEKLSYIPIRSNMNRL